MFDYVSTCLTRENRTQHPVGLHLLRDSMDGGCLSGTPEEGNFVPK